MEQKIICFDLDGTLTPSSTWEIFNATLGISPEQDLALFEQYKQGTIGYDEWIIELVRIYKENGIVTQTELKAVAEEIAFREDAIQAVQDAKMKGYTTVLLSGSIDCIVRVVAQKLGFDTWFATNKAQFNDQNELISIISMGDEGPAKLQLLTQFCETQGVSLETVICVGDGGNEKDIFEKAKGILLGNKEILVPLAWKQVQTLSEVTKLI